MITMNSCANEEESRASSKSIISRIYDNTQRCTKTGFAVGVTLGAGIGFRFGNYQLVRITREPLGFREVHIQPAVVQITQTEVNVEVLSWFFCTSLGGILGGSLGFIEGVLEGLVYELNLVMILWSEGFISPH